MRESTMRREPGCVKLVHSAYGQPCLSCMWSRMSCNRLQKKVLPLDRYQILGHKLEASTLNSVYANYEEGKIWALDLGSLLSINQSVKEVCSILNPKV
jgi:hypothetical protein